MALAFQPRRFGKLIEGHARGLNGADLQAYLAAGVTSDHELTSAEDALEKLRAGYFISCTVICSLPFRFLL